ncbi:MAG: hypothetical protein ACI9CQ_003830, partial [Saprospiraceae bacterium]
MFKYPPEFSTIISVFSPLFSKKIFDRASQLLLGCILTHGKRTVCSVLRTLGLNGITNWDKYHRVLSRAVWSPLKCARQLLKLLIKRLINSDTLVFGMDETIERRWGPKIKARGIYRDAVRSSKSHFVKCSGLRWVCVMLLSPIPWAGRVWALPFLTVLAPSERYYFTQGKRHKVLSDWARQICLLLHRWLADYKCIMLGDGSYAVLELLEDTRRYVTWITRFRMDAALYNFLPKQSGKRGRGRPPVKGERLPSLKERLIDPETKWEQVVFSQWYAETNKEMEITSGTAIWYRGGKPAVPIKWVLISDPQNKLKPMAIQSTDLDLEPIEIVRHYLKRWCVEVTFEEVREHLGVETQRQWSNFSILRTTPCLMALFSIVTLWADQLVNMQKLTVFQTAWYKKTNPTFSDAVASVRYRIWQYQISLR